MYNVLIIEVIDNQTIYTPAGSYNTYQEAEFRKLVLNGYGLLAKIVEGGGN